MPRSHSGNSPSICDANKAVSADVEGFMLNVADVKEESISDYLIWKWRELDKRFHYIKITPYTRHEENTTTGADFDLELWLVGRTVCVPLLIQAKKLAKPFDSYVRKLSYPSGTKRQLKTLISYARTNKRLPFYAFYAIPDESTATMCGRGNATNGAVFMADAYKVKEFADGMHGNRISKSALLRASNPFHCMFCCPLVGAGGYFRRYFPGASAEFEPAFSAEPPRYIRMLLSGDLPRALQDDTGRIVDEYQLRPYRAVGVYDLREENWTPG